MAATKERVAVNDELMRGLSGADLVDDAVRADSNGTGSHEPGQTVRDEVPRDERLEPLGLPGFNEAIDVTGDGEHLVVKEGGEPTEGSRSGDEAPQASAVEIILKTTRGVEKRFGKPYVWVTWLTRLLSGENICTYSLWYRSHFKYPKVEDRGFNSAEWQANHTALVSKRRKELGGIITLEDQNDVKLVGESAVLSGKIDIVAREVGTAIVSDAKTGKKASADWWQVLVYLFAIKYLAKREQRWAKLGRVSGEVVYHDNVVKIPNEELTEARETQIVEMLKVAGSDLPPEARPSARECGYCDISTCTYRAKAEAAVAHTDRF